MSLKEVLEIQQTTAEDHKTWDHRTRSKVGTFPAYMHFGILTNDALVIAESYFSTVVWTYSQSLPVYTSPCSYAMEPHFAF